MRTSVSATLAGAHSGSTGSEMDFRITKHFLEISI